MAVEFDPGYGPEPFRTVVERYPGRHVYPSRDFRVEWGPIFRRGRLDAPARDLPTGLLARMAASADWAERRVFGAVPERATLTSPCRKRHGTGATDASDRSFRGRVHHRRARRARGRT